MSNLPELKNIPGYPGYKVSKSGDVYSFRLKKPRLLSRVANCRSGYIYVNLRNALGKRCHVSLHRCVARAWIENPKNLKEVNHIDHDKSNCSVDNLEWVTGQENKQKYRRFVGEKRGVQYCPEKNKKNPYFVKFYIQGLPTLNLGCHKTADDAYKIFYDTFLEWNGVAPW